MSDKPKPLPPLPPQPPVGQEAPPLGEDVPQNPALRRSRAVRSGAMVMPAVWEEA